MPSGLALSSLDATMPGLWPCFEPERAMLREAPALRPDGDLLARLRRSSLKERSKSSVEVLRPRDFHRDVRPTQPSVEAESLFHQHWWLDAVAGSQWQEVTVADNGTVVGRLPYVESRTFGMRVLGMPPFTKMLGPWIAPRVGKTTDHEDHLAADRAASFSRLFQAASSCCLGLRAAVPIRRLRPRDRSDLRDRLPQRSRR